MKIQFPPRNNEPIEITDEIKFELSNFLRIIGYFLLIFSLIDYLVIILPPQFLDPVGEFETMGHLVDHILAPLVGLGLVFYGQKDIVSRQELRLLNFLSWAALILGIAYLPKIRVWTGATTGGLPLRLGVGRQDLIYF